MTDEQKAALRALAEAAQGTASHMTSAQIGEATAAFVSLRDAMHPAAVLALLDEVERLREALDFIMTFDSDYIPTRQAQDTARAALEPRA